tara:strand:- start:793 stop:951 length:159 start_codon:yes stop_codon:yes gene_type:complete
MDFSKQDIKIIIRCLSDIKFLNQTNKNPFKSSIDLKELSKIIKIFKNYLNSK